MDKRRKFGVIFVIFLFLNIYFAWLHKSGNKFSFDNIIGIQQNDSLLLEFTKEKLLFPPSTKEYNLTDQWKFKNWDGDLAKRQMKTQVQTVFEILKRINQMENGFFVECGANNGEFLSSTLELEKDFGWSGLLVEADPTAFSDLRSKNRKAWTSPACLSINPYPEKMTFLSNSKYSPLSGLSSFVKFKKNNTIPVNITCLPIFTLLSALNVKTVDYFALDVEGVELKVLRTIPFDSIFIKVFSVEITHIPEGKDALKIFLESKGYIFTKNLVVAGFVQDYVFVHKSL